MAVIGTSGAIAYLNSSRSIDRFTENKPATASTEKAKKGPPPLTAEQKRSIDFLKIRLETMLKEGTLTDVKAVCKQIEDSKLETHIPDYARAKNIIKSVPNPCGKPQIIKDPTRYQNQPLTDFTHNNFVPYYRGRHTQNMIGTGVSSGNWNSTNEGSTVTQMKRDTGNDPFTRAPKSTRDPETSVFSMKELVTAPVWGSPLIRPDLDRYVDVTSSRPDLRSTETIQVGPGMNTDDLKNVHDRGFHDLYRGLDDAKATLNSKVKEANSAPSPTKGKFAGGNKTSGQIPFAGGLKPAAEENFGQGDADIVSKYQGSGFVVKRCNEGGAVDYFQLPNTGPGVTRFTGEYTTEQLLRPETKRDQTTPNVDTHYPGLQTGKVQKGTVAEGDIAERSSFNHNIKNFRTAIDRGKSVRNGLPTGILGNTKISGHDSGPGRFYLNENYTENSQMPVINVTSTAGELGAFKGSGRITQSANTTNRELMSEGTTNLGTYGSKGKSGHRTGFVDRPRQNHRETTNSDSVILGAPHVGNIKAYQSEDSQRNNLRYNGEVEARPNPGRTNVLNSVKVRVGGYQLNDIRAMGEVADRPNGNTARNQERTYGQTNTNYNKIVESFSDPLIGRYMPGAYAKKPEDSRGPCKVDESFKGV